jgi:ATP-binding cassette subfamily B protein
MSRDADDDDLELGEIDGRELRFLARFLGRFCRPYRRLGLLLAMVLFFETVFNGAFPVATRYLIDDGLVKREPRALVAMLSFLAFAAVMLALLGLCCDYLTAHISSAVVGDIRLALFEHLQALPLAYYPRTPLGALLSRFSGDIVGLEGALVSLIPWLILPALQVVCDTGLMFWFSPGLGLLGLLVFPVVLWGPRLFADRALAIGYKKRRSEAGLLNVVQEHLGAQPMVRAFGLEPHARDRLVKRGARWSYLAFRFNFFSFLVERTANTGGYLLHLFVFGLGAYWVFIDRLSLGSFVAFEGMFLSMSESLAYVTQFVPTLAQAAGSARHIDEIFDEKLAVQDPPNAPPAPRFGHQIAFHSVGYSFPDGLFRLQDLEFQIERGSHVALVGSSGSGKSTILNLILRFHDPTTGSILVDGRDLRGFGQSSWRAQLGVVFQETILFHTSVLENIRLGSPAATVAQVEAAARAAEIHDFILTLPDGYATTVGERGSQLSGGQRQRIAIARALVRDPSILILDEATSALDYATEASVLKTLRTVTEGRTVIQVTHRLDSLIDVDHIILLDQGKLVEQGTHEDLLELGGHYAQLLQSSPNSA